MILMLLTMLYDRRSVHRIRMNVKDSRSEERGMAIELIDLLVSEPLRTVLISYFWGLKFYKVDYNLRKIFIYSALAVVLYFLSVSLHFNSDILHFSVNTGFLLLYCLVIYFLEVRKLTIRI